MIFTLIYIEETQGGKWSKNVFHIGKKIALYILTFSFWLTAPFSLYVRAEETQENLQLYAQSAVLMDASSGRVLYGKNEEQIMPMASTTKIMTCIVALENGNMEDAVEVSSYAASMPKVHLAMQTGEYFKLKDLLYSLMLESHNDSAVAIAEHIGGSVEGFAKMMNQKARDIGCFDTFFITPNGLDAVVSGSEKMHSTTAKDLAKIMSYCIGISEKKEEFLEITRTSSYGFSNYKKTEAGELVQGNRYFSCNNHNAFLGMMEGALSGKTGFTSKAGYCYVGALERDGKTFAVALLACGWPNNKTYKWSDTKKLMNYGLENYEYHSFSEIVLQKDKLVPLKAEHGQTERIGEEAYINIEVVEEGASEILDADKKGLEGLLLSREEKIEVEYQIKKRLAAPVQKGEPVGKILYKVGGEVYKSQQVITKEGVEEIDFFWCMEKVLWNFGL